MAPALSAEDDRNGDRQRDDEHEDDHEQLSPSETVAVFGRGLPRQVHHTCIASRDDRLERTSSTIGTTTTTASETASATLSSASKGSRWKRWYSRCGAEYTSSAPATTCTR